MGPWYGQESERVRFERGIQQQFPTLQAFTNKNGKTAGRHYVITLPINHYESRRVKITFQKCSPSTPRIKVDGPTESPHRFLNGNLCIWFPDDPKENKWVIADGLLQLLGLIETHLFREAWWRERGEWLGPEAPHKTPPETAA